MSTETARQTPLLDLLRGVPQDGRAIYDHDPMHSQSIPYGRLCHEAADALTAAEAERAALRARVVVLEAQLRNSWPIPDEAPVVLAPSSEPQP